MNMEILAGVLLFIAFFGVIGFIVYDTRRLSGDKKDKKA